MEIVLFTLAAIALYFAADWILRTLEARRGAPFKHRGIIYFAIILPLTLLVFKFMENLGSTL
jgi:TRAP-type C4-dicarboxylate transport system permease small subunit